METPKRERPVYLERTGARVGDGPERVIERPGGAAAALAGVGVYVEMPGVEVPPADEAR